MDRKWLIGTGVAVLTFAGSFLVPEVRCTLKISNDCAAFVDVEIVVESEQRQPLEQVEVRFKSKGAPESKKTDSAGFARIRIPKTDKVDQVDIVLSKPGFQTKAYPINLKNDTITTQTYLLPKENESNPQPSSISPNPRSTVPLPSQSSVLKPVLPVESSKDKLSEGEVKGTFEKFIQSWNNKDLGTMDSLLTADFRSLSKDVGDSKPYTDLNRFGYLDKKKEIFGLSRSVKVTVDENSVKLSRLENQSFLVRYYQRYSSRGYGSYGTNEFYFCAEDGRVKICKEVFTREGQNSGS